MQSFSSSTPLENLPNEFRMCLPPNPASNACDSIVNKYCSQPPYNQTIYCACVNNSMPCPMVTSVPCANSIYSYKPMTMQDGGVEFQNCKGATICVSDVNVYGSNNVVKGVVQDCGTISNITNTFNKYPALSSIMFIIFISLIVLIIMNFNKKKIPPEINIL